MNLSIDFINTDGQYAITEQQYKIDWNIQQILVFLEEYNKRKTNNTRIGTMIANVGRWITILQSNLTDADSLLLHFIDFRIDVDSLERNNHFSVGVINAIKQFQKDYDKNFNQNSDTVELTYAEPFEKVVKENIFVCDDDKEVLKKANTLGVLLEVKSLDDNEKVKIVFVDERISLNDKPVLNIYGMVQFGGHPSEQACENGFAYFKLFDIENNFEKLVDFISITEKAIGKIDRAYLSERFPGFHFN